MNKGFEKETLLSQRFSMTPGKSLYLWVNQKEVIIYEQR